MPLNIIRNDITRVSADAIVNTANPEVAIGYGVDSSIYDAAGAEDLLKERAKIGPMRPGQAAWTPAFALDAKYIIHTVGPAWQGGAYGEFDDLASCYKESLRIADELKCESIAFPMISTGTYGFPKDKALQIAIREISSFLFTHDMNVYMVVYDKESFVISGKAFSQIRTYIEEKDVRVPPREELERRGERNVTTKREFRRMEARESRLRSLRERYLEQRRRRKLEREADQFLEEKLEAPSAPKAGGGFREDADVMFDMSPDESTMQVFDEDLESASLSESSAAFDEEMFIEARGLDGIVGETGETFQQMLFRLIDRKGLKDPDVYKRANIDRKLFSKIRSNPNYKPKKNTVLAFAVALELNLDETVDLLRSAGYAFMPSSKSDLIVSYCIVHKIYNIFDINTYLFDYEEPILAG